MKELQKQVVKRVALIGVSLEVGGPATAPDEANHEQRTCQIGPWTLTGAIEPRHHGVGIHRKATRGGVWAVMRKTRLSGSISMDR